MKLTSTATFRKLTIYDLKSDHVYFRLKPRAPTVLKTAFSSMKNFPFVGARIPIPEIDLFTCMKCIDFVRAVVNKINKQTICLCWAALSVSRFELGYYSFRKIQKSVPKFLSVLFYHFRSEKSAKVKFFLRWTEILYEREKVRFRVRACRFPVISYDKSHAWRAFTFTVSQSSRCVLYFATWNGQPASSRVAWFAERILQWSNAPLVWHAHTRPDLVSRLDVRLDISVH